MTENTQFGSIRSALFVDFDNIFTGLRHRHGPEIATAFANHPDRWLRWLVNGAPETDTQYGPKRRILLRYCYINPDMFSNFRPHFVRASFTVVDCPHLTSNGKNSTDIHMVLDILDALTHETKFVSFRLACLEGISESDILAGRVRGTLVVADQVHHQRREVFESRIKRRAPRGPAAW